MVAQRRLHGEPPASARRSCCGRAATGWSTRSSRRPIFAARPPMADRAAAHRAARAAAPRVRAALLRRLGDAAARCCNWRSGCCFNRREVRAFVQRRGRSQFWQKRRPWTCSAGSSSRCRSASSSTCRIAGIAHAIRYFVEASEREVQMARLSEQLAGARLAALQAQLNPHFLFNSLNTIAVLVRDGEPRHGDARHRAAERRAAQHAEPHAGQRGLARRRAGAGAAVSRGRAGALLRSAAARCSTSIPRRCSAAVPRFALQHLVENALRHGIARRTDAGRVVVTARRDGDMLELSVEDDGAGLTAPAATRRALDRARTREHARAPAHALRRSRLARGDGRGAARHDRAAADSLSRDDRAGGTDDDAQR